MNFNILKTLALGEVRLRMRRTSTFVALLAVVAISWMMIADPAGGSALIVVKHTRVLYTSTALAIGSASLGCLLFGLGGFYLVRGRMSEDIRSGAGGVIGATPVGNVQFLVGRWLGGAAYLGAMVFAFMLTIMVLHAVRGDGPIQPMIYLTNYILILLPLVLFTVSTALLFDSWSPLMGKGGDVLFFLLWAAQLGVVGAHAENGLVPLVELFDFNGLGASMLAVTAAVGHANVSLGDGEFNAALTPIRMADHLWTANLVLLRAASCVVGVLPLVMAFGLFHRFSPDKVKVARAGKRRSPLAVINTLFKPLSRAVSPLFALAARIGGVSGQTFGDVALTLAAAPFAVLALAASALAAMVVPHAALAPVTLAAVVFWGVLVSDLSTRDFGADAEAMAAAVHGGAVTRFLRQYAATVLLGLMFTAVAAARYAASEPMRALALVAGVFSLAALASGFGRCSRSARLFLGLFLFWFYVSLNGGKVALLDAVGFLGVANWQSVAVWLCAGALALGTGYMWNRRPF
ncbi:hypothetical protein [Massilia sp. CF038]|uniref:hypothetical protein n=1 Tax=Massilia sp. CF038 TaxID=1881045 RepID=UPI000917BE6B|nr:hypothetical protein [Massilia sp. CF038]SHG41128.1 hypothetical protein SAMN05428948_0339 [Massilia sp. CF038]